MRAARAALAPDLEVVSSAIQAVANAKMDLVHLPKGKDATSAEDALHGAQMRLIRALNTAAETAAFGSSGEMWGRHLIRPPPKLAVEEGLKLLKAAEVVLDTELCENERAQRGAVVSPIASSSDQSHSHTSSSFTSGSRPSSASGHRQRHLDRSTAELHQAASDPNASTFESSSAVKKAATFVGDTSLNVNKELFRVLWPRLMTYATSASILDVAQRPRRAYEYSKKAVALLHEAMPNPDMPVEFIMSASGGATWIAERCVSVVSSHAALLHRLGRHADALPFAQMACSMCRHLHDLLLHRATHKLMEEARESDTMLWAGIGWDRHDAYQEAVVSRTPVALLLSFCLYNASCILAATQADEHRHRHRIDEMNHHPIRLMESAKVFAAPHLQADHPFLVLTRKKIAQLTPPAPEPVSPLDPPRAAASVRPSSSHQRMEANHTLIGLRAAHGRVQQRKAARQRSTLSKSEEVRRHQPAKSMLVAGPPVTESWLTGVIPT